MIPIRHGHMSPPTAGPTLILDSAKNSIVSLFARQQSNKEGVTEEDSLAVSPTKSHIHISMSNAGVLVSPV